MSSPAFVVAGFIGFATLCIWRVMAGKKQKDRRNQNEQHHLQMEDDFQDFLDVDGSSLADSSYSPPTIPRKIQNRNYGKQRGGGAGGGGGFNNNNNIDQDELDFNIKSSNNNNTHNRNKNNLHNKRSIVDEYDQIDILGTSTKNNNNNNTGARYSGQNISNFSTDSQIRGADKIALKKQTVNKFLKRVEKTKKRFVQYQTAKKEAKLKRRLGIPQSDRERQQLEDFKWQNSQYYNQSILDDDDDDDDDEQEYNDEEYDEDDDDVQSQYLDECNSMHSHGLSQRSHFTAKSAPTPYLAQTPGGPVIRNYNNHHHHPSRSHKNMQKNKVGVKPKDFKKKDDFVFFDLFTLYAQNYMGKNKNKKEQQMMMNNHNHNINRRQEIIEQDDLQFQSQIVE